MDNITSLVQYGGNWNENNEYQGYTMTGILIPPNCSLDNLVNLIKKEIKEKTATIEVFYQVEKGTPPMKVVTDNSVLFFLEIKKKVAAKITDLPLCVTIVQESSNENDLLLLANQKATAEEMEVGTLLMQANQASINEQMLLEEGMSSTTNEGINVSYIPHFAEEAADFIIEDNTKRKKKLDEIQLVISDYRVNTIEQGQIYKDKNTVKSALSYYAMLHNFQFKTKRSEPREYLVTCADEKCNWLVRASKYRNQDLFKVWKCNPNHTCYVEIVLEDHRQAKSIVVGELIKNKYKSIKRNYTPNDIMNDMNDDFGVTMGYIKAWRSREKALRLVRGNPDDSYQKLPIYLYMLKQENPGTITHLLTDKEDRFKYLYIAFSNSIKASTLDSNNNIFVLAFGIADSENDNSWLWFFSKLRETYGEPEGLAIVSDRHKNTDNAVHMVYPNAFHGACMFHLLNNLKGKYGSHGEELQMKFIAAAKAYTQTECENYMKGLDRIDRRIRPYLEKAKYETWARSYSPTKRYTMMTSNIAESLNAALKAARNLPIDILVECLRSLVQKWVWNNSNNANGTFTKVSTSTENELRHDIVSKMKYEVLPFNTIEYQVRDQKGINFTVNIHNRTCTCNRFQEDEIPCGHAVAVIAKRNLSVYDYCAKFYRTETLKALYQENVHPLPHKDEWNLPQHLDIIVLPPNATIPAGRPRKKRIRSRGENKVIITCEKCAQPGHNRKTCRNPPFQKPNKQKKPKT
ncbi:uncharacterized protein LOC133795308 [Humulus lupulus]|uniref:uncharacterized protein LOC133795308 n=1 Tax=Humulus lupulus TaxID=3486 RepID=UPI002B415F16|nr:uncharacterized protein LOC133795308 [Humulus lupulus]